MVLVPAFSFLVHLVELVRIELTSLALHFGPKLDRNHYNPEEAAKLLFSAFNRRGSPAARPLQHEPETGCRVDSWRPLYL